MTKLGSKKCNYNVIMMKVLSHEPKIIQLIKRFSYINLTLSLFLTLTLFLLLIKTIIKVYHSYFIKPMHLFLIFYYYDI